MRSEIQNKLFALQDLGYRDFHSKLMPTVDQEKVIGVRMPQLRKLAAAFAKDPQSQTFLQTLPHFYYEENNLHGLLIEKIADYDACVAALDAFLPHVDNWATCDLMAPKAFKNHPPQLMGKIAEWMRSNETYTVRFAIGMLLRFYLDEHFDKSHLEMVASIRSEEYYINMMIAWYFATALAKQYASALPYLQQHRLAAWTHQKTIQKAVESYRITPEQKTYLKTLRIKGLQKKGM